MARELRLAAATAAFDRLAPEYDRLAAGDLFAHQRRRTHARLRAWLPARSRVLEIGCGTGIDTEFLARRGIEVVACDPSSEMQRLTMRRTVAAGLGDRVRVLDSGLRNVPALLDGRDGPGFDAVVSNFGALNCIEDLAPLGVIAAMHLRPGGSMLLCVMGRYCLWEMAYFAATGRAETAGRRHRQAALVPVAGIAVPTYYHGIPDLHRALGGDMTLTNVSGIGVLSPPPYLEPRWQRVPALLRVVMTGADRVVAGWPVLNRCGDHVLTRWVKRRHGHA
jgi:SAM-dependent methyltransferase